MFNLKMYPNRGLLSSVVPDSDRRPPVEEPHSVLSEGNVYFRKPQLESQRNTFNFKVRCMKVLYELLRVKYRSNSKEMYRESIEQGR